jgi:hypothetical protein
MKLNLRKALLLSSILCICILLAGIVFAEGDGTYGAYPGAPTPATGQLTPGQTTVVEKTVTSIQTGKPVIQLGSVGRSTVSSTITATYTNQAPPVTQQSVLLPYSVQTAPPAAVYYRGTFMPWASFNQIFPAKSPALWVASSAGWSWDARCPVGGWIQNLMYVPYTGTMKLYEFYPDGSIKLYSYGFATPGYKYIWFYADTPGRHITLFTIFDNPSNYIMIDVY